MKIFLYLCTFVFGFFGVGVAVSAIELAVTGGAVPLPSMALGFICLLISIACWQRARKRGDDEEAAATNSTLSEPFVSNGRQHQFIPAPTPPDNRMVSHIADASLFAPLLAIVIGILLQHQIHWDLAGMKLVGCIPALLITTGLMLGIIALTDTRRYGRAAIFRKALAGTVLNGFFILSFAAVFLIHTILVRSGFTNSATPATAGRQDNATADRHNKATAGRYDNNGVQFSYDAAWAVSKEDSEDLLILRQDHTGMICLSFYPPDANPDLETFASKLPGHEPNHRHRRWR